MISSEILDLIQKQEISDDLKAIILQDHFQRQSETRAANRVVKKTIFANGPFLAAAASVAAALLSGIFAYGSVLNQSASERTLEELKFDFELIRTALSDHKSPEERMNSLVFFQSVGFLTNLQIDQIDKATIPSIATNAVAIFTVENLYPETAGTLGLILSEDEISPESKTWKKFWHLYRVDLIGVESREVARAMVAFGRELTALSKDRSAPNKELRDLAIDVIDAMALEVPNVAAFKEKLSSEL